MIGTLAARWWAMWELAFGNPLGLRRFTAGRGEILRSFWVMAIALPAEVAQRIDIWALDPVSIPATRAVQIQALATEAMMGLVSWLVFLVIAHEICRLFRREARWGWLVMLWNWSQLVQGTLTLSANLPDLLGAPAAIGECLTLLNLCWAIWFDWKVIRISLAVPVLDAALLVAVDAVISNALPVLVSHINRWV
jgi:hypothetical protein